MSYSTSPTRLPQDVYSDLVNAAPTNAPPLYLRIAPGDPAHSWLLVKITEDEPGGTGYGARMPLGLPDVCPETVQAFTSWIIDGAPSQ